MAILFILFLNVPCKYCFDTSPLIFLNIKHFIELIYLENVMLRTFSFLYKKNTNFVMQNIQWRSVLNLSMLCYIKIMLHRHYILFCCYCCCGQQQSFIFCVRTPLIVAYIHILDIRKKMIMMMSMCSTINSFQVLRLQSMNPLSFFFVHTYRVLFNVLTKNDLCQTKLNFFL